MQEVIILKGIPASGKSTWAKQKVKEGKGEWKHINKDTLRLMIDFEQYSKTREEFIQTARNALLGAALRERYSVIIDDTNLHPKHEKRIREITADYANYVLKKEIGVSVRWFPIPLNVAIERDKRREAKVGEKVIERMFKQYLEAGGPDPNLGPSEVETAPEYNPTLLNAVVIDLDGTLALFEHHRGPYDGEKCADDAVNEAVKYIIDHIWGNTEILLLSGRDKKYRRETMEFLTKNEIEYDELWMRDYDDVRKDSIIKKELYDEHIRDQYNVVAIFDDRDQVVQMWRSLGIPCFQVNYGKF